MLDLLLPQRCLVCSRAGVHMCVDCTAALRRIAPPVCERCGCPTAWPVRRCAECSGRRLAFARARAALAYDEPLRHVVAAWKERGLRRLAAWAAGVVSETLPRPDTACLVHVPGERDRRLERGHHAAESLAAELASVWNLPLESLLARERGSLRQRGLSRPERRRNVARAFCALGRAPPEVCVVDDVYTTGATVNAVASTLRSAGAKRIEIVTFARAIRVS